MRKKIINWILGYDLDYRLYNLYAMCSDVKHHLIKRTSELEGTVQCLSDDQQEIIKAVYTKNQGANNG